MKTCKQIQTIERWFDGESVNLDVESHLKDCAACTEHWAFLKQTRERVHALREQPTITEDQFSAYMRGIHDGTDRPQQRRISAGWTWLSACAAAVIVAVSLLSIFSTGPQPVDARSTVEETSSEIDGATMQSYDEADGTATVWVSLPEGDMW